jgi:hypothetical protein
MLSNLTAVAPAFWLRHGGEFIHSYCGIFNLLPTAHADPAIHALLSTGVGHKP